MQNKSQLSRYKFYKWEQNDGRRDIPLENPLFTTFPHNVWRNCHIALTYIIFIQALNERETIYVLDLFLIILMSSYALKAWIKEQKVVETGPDE